jgi:hypothetical protein
LYEELCKKESPFRGKVNHKGIPTRKGKAVQSSLFTQSGSAKHEAIAVRRSAGRPFWHPHQTVTGEGPYHHVREAGHRPPRLPSVKELSDDFGNFYS